MVLLLAGLGVLGACSDDDPGPDPGPTSDPTVSVDEAPDTYRPLVSSVVDAVAEVSVPGRSDGDPEVVYYDTDLGSCVYASLRYEFDTVFGEDASWDDVRGAVVDVVEPEGFEVSDQLDIPGGYNGFDATADDGTRLEVRSKVGDPSTVALDAPVTGDCPSDGSQTVAPG